MDKRQSKRWLYDLAADPRERNDLSGSNPAMVAELQALLDAQDADIGARSFPVLIEGPIPIDRTQKDPYVPGEAYAYWSN